MARRKLKGPYQLGDITEQTYELPEVEVGATASGPRYAEYGLPYAKDENGYYIKDENGEFIPDWSLAAEGVTPWSVYKLVKADNRELARNAIQHGAEAAKTATMDPAKSPLVAVYPIGTALAAGMYLAPHFRGAAQINNAKVLANKDAKAYIKGTTPKNKMSSYLTFYVPSVLQGYLEALDNITFKKVGGVLNYLNYFS